MITLKVEGRGSLEIGPDKIIAFEEIPESMIEDRPKAKCTIYFDLGEGLTSHVLENKYDMVLSKIDRMRFQELNLGGPNSITRRMSIPRGSIIYMEDIDRGDLPEEENSPKTIVKVTISGQLITLASTDTREDISLG